mgnify:CR=1 FL=1
MKDVSLPTGILRASLLQLPLQTEGCRKSDDSSRWKEEALLQDQDLPTYLQMNDVVLGCQLSIAVAAPPSTYLLTLCSAHIPRDIRCKYPILTYGIPTYMMSTEHLLYGAQRNIRIKQNSVKSLSMIYEQPPKTRSQARVQQR